MQGVIGYRKRNYTFDIESIISSQIILEKLLVTYASCSAAKIERDSALLRRLASISTRGTMTLPQSVQRRKIPGCRVMLATFSWNFN